MPATATTADRPAPSPSTAPNLALDRDLARTWLGWQCGMLAGVIRGALYAAGDGQPPLALWPGAGEGAESIERTVAEVLSQGQAVDRARIAYGSAGERSCDLVAVPVRGDDGPVAAVVVMISPRSEPQRQAVRQLLQWGVLWLEHQLHRQAGAQRDPRAFHLQLITAVLGHRNRRVTAMEIVNRLAERLHCSRVGIGIRERHGCRLLALSGQAHFDPRANPIRRIEAAMDEAVDQDALLAIPARPGDEPLIQRAQRELAGLHGDNAAVLSLPLHGPDGPLGAITLERLPGHPFEDEEREELEELTALLGPLLHFRIEEERPPGARLARAAAQLADGLIGPSHGRLKLLILLLAAGIAGAALIETDYRIGAPAHIEALEQRVLVAPFDGFVISATARAGQNVRKGQTIARLDDREPRLALDKWRSRRAQTEREYQQALAQRELGRLSILRARLRQIDAEIHLAEDRLAHTRLIAPLDGTIVRGDLSQSLGAPVKTGEVLFEIAPLDHYRAVVEIDERDIGQARAGGDGELVLSAMPDRPLNLHIQRILPLAIEQDGHNRFRAEATLATPPEGLRPGMRGVAHLDAGRRPLLWVWSHGLIDRLRLWAWSHGW